MFSSVDSCMAVATAMTADRRPLFLARVWRTIVVAFWYRAGVICIHSCGPLVPVGVSLSCAGSGPWPGPGMVRPATVRAICCQLSSCWREALAGAAGLGVPRLAAAGLVPAGGLAARVAACLTR